MGTYLGADCCVISLVFCVFLCVVFCVVLSVSLVKKHFLRQQFLSHSVSGSSSSTCLQILCASIGAGSGLDLSLVLVHSPTHSLTFSFRLAES